MPPPTPSWETRPPGWDARTGLHPSPAETLEPPHSPWLGHEGRCPGWSKGPAATLPPGWDMDSPTGARSPEPPHHPPPAGTLEPPLSPQLGHGPPIYFPTLQLEHGPPKTVLPPSAGPLELRSGHPGDGITPTPGLALELGLGPSIQGRDMDPLHPGWDMGPHSSPGLGSSLSCSMDFCQTDTGATPTALGAPADCGEPLMRPTATPTPEKLRETDRDGEVPAGLERPLELGVMEPRRVGSGGLELGEGRGVMGGSEWGLGRSRGENVGALWGRGGSGTPQMLFHS